MRSRMCGLVLLSAICLAAPTVQAQQQNMKNNVSGIYQATADAGSPIGIMHTMDQMVTDQFSMGARTIALFNVGHDTRDINAIAIVELVGKFSFPLPKFLPYVGAGVGASIFYEFEDDMDFLDALSLEYSIFAGSEFPVGPGRVVAELRYQFLDSDGDSFNGVGAAIGFTW